MSRRKHDPKDPYWPVSTAAVAAAIRVWGGSHGDLAIELDRLGVAYKRGGIDFLVSGRTKTAPYSVLTGIATVTLGDEKLAGFLTQTPGVTSESDASDAAAYAYRVRINRRLDELGVHRGLVWAFTRTLASNPWYATRLVLGSAAAIGMVGVVSERVLSAVEAAIEGVDRGKPSPFDLPWYVEMLERMGHEREWIDLEVANIDTVLLAEIEQLNSSS